ncbi:MAG: hypothetical protein ACMXYM_03855 [Candidatus Woesearchaeota archaeon]
MRPRRFAPLLLFGALPAVSANPIVDIIVGLGDFTRRFSFAGETAFIGLVALALFVLYLILFQMVFKAINKNNQNASPRLVNAGIIVFSAILAIFSSVNLPREALRALVQQYTVLGYILLGIVVPFGIIAFAVWLKHKHQDNPGVSVGAGILLVLLGLNLTSAIEGLGAVGLDGTVFWLTLIQWIVIIAGAWMALSPLFGLFKGLGFGGAGATGDGGAGGAGGAGGGGGQRGALPSQIHNFQLHTEPDPSMDARPEAERRYRIRVEWVIPPDVIHNERINNYQVNVRPGRFITRQYAPGRDPNVGFWRNAWRNVSPGGVVRNTRATAGGVFPFTGRKYFSASHSPAIVPHPDSYASRFPYNAEFEVFVRAKNPSGYGPWSSGARIVIGSDLGANPPSPPPNPVNATWHLEWASHNGVRIDTHPGTGVFIQHGTNTPVIFAESDEIELRFRTVSGRKFDTSRSDSSIQLVSGGVIVLSMNMRNLTTVGTLETNDTKYSFRFRIPPRLPTQNYALRVTLRTRNI